MLTNTDFICATGSQQCGEQLLGTAPRVDVWFALEYPKPYGRKAFEESGLLTLVKDRFSEVLASVPNSRLQLIKKGTDLSDEKITFLVAVNHEEEPNLYEFGLSAYEDLLTLDIPGIVAEKRAYWQYDRTEPLFLVCTNAKRDQCCARFGLPVYRAMTDYAGESVWQTSHVGGHRFSGNVVVLPHGIYYGRVGPDDAGKVAHTYREGQVYLEKYRGRTCYDKLVQAAEAFLRQESGNVSLGQFKLIEIENLSENRWIVHFTELSNGQSHCVHLRSEISFFELYKSCADENLVHLSQYRLVDYQARAPVVQLEV